MTRSIPARLPKPSRVSFSAGPAEGWTTTALRLGANRAISADQFASSEAGATRRHGFGACRASFFSTSSSDKTRSEEHTSELQSPCNLVCRLLLEKKK